MSRAQVAEALLAHYETTHGDVGEHDHHCHMGWAKPEPPCTCGYQGLLDALAAHGDWIPDAAVIQPDNGCGCSYCRRVAAS